MAVKYTDYISAEVPFVETQSVYFTTYLFIQCILQHIYSSNECPRYDTKPSDGEATVMLEL